MNPDLQKLTAKIVSAYVRNNTVPGDQLASIITAVYSALSGTTVPVQAKEEATPAVPVRRSVKSDKIICLECGKGFSILKRHLRTDHDMTDQEYRAKWGLPNDYPLVAPTYSARRSDMAKQIGLGHNRRRSEGTDNNGLNTVRVMDLEE